MTTDEIRQYTFGVLRAREAYREDRRNEEGLCIECERPTPSYHRYCPYCRALRRRGVKR